MNVVAYLRVSTDRQAEEGFGLAVQERSIRSWGKREGHRIVAWCRDEGVAGSNGIADRVGLPEAVSYIASNDAEAIVVAHIDRLARLFTVQEAILAEVWKLGGSVYSADVGEIARDDPDDPYRTFVRQVMGAAAQLERSLVAFRMRSGRSRKREQGGYADGAPPYGYRAERGKLVPDPAQQRVIRRARELEAAGLSQHQIAARLTGEGHRTKQGKAWSRFAVGQVLRREAVRA